MEMPRKWEGEMARSVLDRRNQQSIRKTDDWVRRLDEMSTIEPRGLEEAMALLVGLEELIQRPVYAGPPPKRRFKAAKRAN